MGQALTSFIEIMGGGITGLATKIGTGLSTMAQAAFLEVDAQGAVTGLSTFGGVLAIFAGISLAVGSKNDLYRSTLKMGNIGGGPLFKDNTEITYIIA